MVENIWPGWRTVRKIGSGGFGTVYEIERDVFGGTEKAALKVISIPKELSEIEELRSEGYDDVSITLRFKDFMEVFAQEYSLMAKLKGTTNVVYCDDFKTVQNDDGIGWTIYIKMELLTPLLKMYNRTMPEEKELLKLTKDICSALVVCKENNIVHRDIKPQNIFISKDGTYKLGDFGIAKTAERTTSGTKIGTYKYMAPEVYNNKPYGTSADIYSLGLVIHWLLNERRSPFLPLPPVTPTANKEEEARERRFRGEPIPPPKNGSPEFKEVVLRACEFNVNDRYASASEMIEDIERIMNGTYQLSNPDDEKTDRMPYDDKTIIDRPVKPVVPVIGKVPGDGDKPGKQTADKGPEKPGQQPGDRQPKKQNEAPLYGNDSPFSGEPASEVRPAPLFGSIGTPDRPGQQESPRPQTAEPLKPDAKEQPAPDKKEAPGKKPKNLKKKEKPDQNPARKPTPSASGTGDGEHSIHQEDEDQKKKKKKLLLILIPAAACVFLALLLLLLRPFGGSREGSEGSPVLGSSSATTETGATEATKFPIQAEWSLWEDELPAYVSEEGYEIEEKTVYRSRSYEYTTSTESDHLNGWELYDTAIGDGDYGAWSGWSDEKVTATQDREVETAKWYRYRVKETKTDSKANLSGWTLYETTYTSGDYGEWSAWSETAVSASNDRQVETEKRYRYRTKETTTGTSSSKSGWTLYDTKYSYGSYGAWSDWSTTAVSGSETKKVETKTQYRYRDTTTTSAYSEWSSWGSWQSSRESTSDTKKEDTRTVWGYYYYRCPNCGLHMPESGTCQTWAGGCGSSISSGNFYSTWSTTDWSSAGFSSWYDPSYQVAMLNGEVVFKYTSSGSPVTQYRYATRTVTTETVKGEWSSWSDTKPTSSSTREIDTRTMYRYCTREQTATYYFYRWGSWSSWSTTARTKSDTQDVETKTFYRSRSKTSTPLYHYYRWGDWSTWTATGYTANDNRQVESKDYYRYREKVYTTTYYFRRWTDWTDYFDLPVEETDEVQVETKQQYRFISK